MVQTAKYKSEYGQKKKKKKKKKATQCIVQNAKYKLYSLHL